MSSSSKTLSILNTGNYENFYNQFLKSKKHFFGTSDQSTIIKLLTIHSNIEKKPYTAIIHANQFLHLHLINTINEIQNTTLQAYVSFLLAKTEYMIGNINTAKTLFEKALVLLNKKSHTKRKSLENDVKIIVKALTLKNLTQYNLNKEQQETYEKAIQRMIDKYVNTKSSYLLAILYKAKSHISCNKQAIAKTEKYLNLAYKHANHSQNKTIKYNVILDLLDVYKIKGELKKGVSLILEIQDNLKTQLNNNIREKFLLLLSLSHYYLIMGLSAKSSLLLDFLAELTEFVSFYELAQLWRVQGTLAFYKGNKQLGISLFTKLLNTSFTHKNPNQILDQLIFLLFISYLNPDLNLTPLINAYYQKLEQFHPLKERIDPLILPLVLLFNQYLHEPQGVSLFFDDYQIHSLTPLINNTKMYLSMESKWMLHYMYSFLLWYEATFITHHSSFNTWNEIITSINYLADIKQSNSYFSLVLGILLDTRLELHYGDKKNIDSLLLEIKSILVNNNLYFLIPELSQIKEEFLLLKKTEPANKQENSFISFIFKKLNIKQTLTEIYKISKEKQELTTIINKQQIMGIHVTNKIGLSIFSHVFSFNYIETTLNASELDGYSLIGNVFAAIQMILDLRYYRSKPTFIELHEYTIFYEPGKNFDYWVILKKTETSSLKDTVMNLIKQITTNPRVQSLLHQFDQSWTKTTNDELMLHHEFDKLLLKTEYMEFND